MSKMGTGNIINGLPLCCKACKLHFLTKAKLFLAVCEKHHLAASTIMKRVLTMPITSALSAQSAKDFANSIWDLIPCIMAWQHHNTPWVTARAGDTLVEVPDSLYSSRAEEWTLEWRDQHQWNWVATVAEVIVLKHSSFALYAVLCMAWKGANWKGWTSRWPWPKSWKADYAGKKEN